MLSYKKIVISEISVDNNNISYQGNNLIIKSPIINFSLDKNNNKVFLNCNDNSIKHGIFLNVLGYIERLYEINGYDVTFINKSVIPVLIDKKSKFFNSNTNEIDLENIIGNKCVCTLYFENNLITLRQLLIVK